MQPYISAVLARVRSLMEEYKVAWEECKVSRSLTRDSEKACRLLDDERACLASLLIVHIDCESTPFEERELLESAAAALRAPIRGS